MILRFPLNISRLITSFYVLYYIFEINPKRSFIHKYPKKRDRNSIILDFMNDFPTSPATKERLIKSYSLVFGTAALQFAVHRNMIPLLSSVNHPKVLSIWNAGFAAGFGWGALSLVYLYWTCLKTGTIGCASGRLSKYTCGG